MTDERLREILAVMGKTNKCPSRVGLSDRCAGNYCLRCWAKAIKEELDNEIQSA